VNALTTLARNSAGQISANSPVILTGFAVAGLITTTVLAVKATPKALLLIEQGAYNEDRDLTKLEVVRVTWKCYLPATGVGLATVLCILGAHSVHTRRTAALAGIYTITEKAFSEYRAKVTETIGKGRELQVRDGIASDRVKANPTGSTEIIWTGKGQVLCYDSLTGRYFKSDIEQIRRSVNILNKRLMNEMYISLNELYYELGLASTSLGESLGWSIEKGLLEITFSTTLNEDGEPCLVMDYAVSPKFI
jgi:hypothetical protein